MPRKRNPDPAREAQRLAPERLAAQAEELVRLRLPDVSSRAELLRIVDELEAAHPERVREAHGAGGNALWLEAVGQSVYPKLRAAIKRGDIGRAVFAAILIGQCNPLISRVPPARQLERIRVRRQWPGTKTAETNAPRMHTRVEMAADLFAKQKQRGESDPKARRAVARKMGITPEWVRQLLKRAERAGHQLR